MRFWRPLVLATLALICLDPFGASPPAGAQTLLTRVVGHGDPSPLGGSPFYTLTFLQLADDGSVAFSGCVDACDRAGIFLKQPAEPTPEVLISTGDLSPGLEALVGTECNRYFPFNRNNAGTIAFHASLESCTSGRYGAYLWTDSGVSTLVETGDEIAGQTVRSVSNPALADDGSTALNVCLNSCGVLIGNNLTLTPQTELWAGTTLIGAAAFGMDGFGRVAYWSNVDEFGVQKYCLTISAVSGMSHTRVACVGDLLFGLPLDQQVRVDTDFNSAGNLVFGSSDQAIYLWSGTVLKVARAGEDTPLGGKYRQFVGYPHINDLNQISFTAEVEYEDGRRIYTVFLYQYGVVTPLYQAGVDTGSIGCPIADQDLNNSGQVLVGIYGCGEPLAYYLGSIGDLAPPPPHRKVIIVDGTYTEASCGPSDSGELRTYLTTNSWLNAHLPAPGLTDQSFVWFSYAGPPSDSNAYCGGDLHKPHYSKGDTCDSIDGATGTVHNLDALVHTLIALDPGVVIDMIGYSQGGLIAAYWAAALAQPGQLDNVHSIVTYDSPIGGINTIVFEGAFYRCLGHLNPAPSGSWADMKTGSTVVRSAQAAAGKTRFYTVRANPGLGLGWCTALCDVVSPDRAASFDGVACDTANDHRASVCGPGKNVVDLHEDMGTHPDLWSSPSYSAKELTACAILGWTCDGGGSMTLPPTVDTDTPIDLNPQVDDGAAVESLDITTTYPTETITLPSDCVIPPDGSGMTCPSTLRPQPVSFTTTTSSAPQYSSGPGWSSWHIDNPVPGIWTHRLTNGGTSDLDVNVVFNRRFTPLPDADTDSIPDATDNCLGAWNADQADTDGDSLGDACDPDDDNDTHDDAADNCPLTVNADQTDTDADGLGNACDGDDDNDGMRDLYEASEPCLVIGSNDSAGDPDSDSLENLTESFLGTEPCSSDTDSDFAPDDFELYCGTNPLDLASVTPERLDGAFAGVDDDGDTEVDEALPPAAGAYDCDGDGFTGAVEAYVFSSTPGDTSRDQTPCAATSTAGDEDPDAWPPDNNDDQRVTLTDVLRYIPVFNSFAPGPPYNPRFDLNASGGITLSDVLLFIPIFGQNCAP